MKTTLSDRLVASYRENGYLYYPGFLDTGEVAELKAAVFEAVSKMGKAKVGGDDKSDFVEKDTYYDRVFTQRLNLWRLNPTVKRYMLSPALGVMLSSLEGVEGFRVWHDQTLIKEPFANPTSWHLDNPYWSFSSKNAVSIWIALEDATLENGCMWFMPGTHKMARFDNAGIGTDMGALFKVYPEMANIDPVAVPMKAGDCSFHNGLVAHGAGPNMTRKRRVAMTSGYMPVGSTFNGQRNILPKDYFQTLKVGDPLVNDDWNPRL